MVLLYLCTFHTCCQPFFPLRKCNNHNNSMTYLFFYGAIKPGDMQRNDCLHMGMLLSTHVQFKSTSPFHCFFFFKKKRLKCRCCRVQGMLLGWWLSLALALFMTWPSVTLRNPNSLVHPWRFCFWPTLKCFMAMLDHIQLCETVVSATPRRYNLTYATI